MRIFSFILVIVLLASNVSGECREKECMPDSFEYFGGEGAKFTFYYDSVFEIGANWFILFEGHNMEDYYNFHFEFEDGLSKEAHLEDRDDFPESQRRNNSISFSGSTFSEEAFHKSLFVNFTDEDGNSGPAFVLKIHINKPPAEDLIFLWGGMTVFWASIGAYVIYLSNKFRELSNKSGLKDGNREKN